MFAAAALSGSLLPPPLVTAADSTGIAWTNVVPTALVDLQYQADSGSSFATAPGSPLAPGTSFYLWGDHGLAVPLSVQVRYRQGYRISNWAQASVS